jgi:hypothetical protein
MAAEYNVVVRIVHNTIVCLENKDQPFGANTNPLRACCVVRRMEMVPVVYDPLEVTG